VRAFDQGPKCLSSSDRSHEPVLGMHISLKPHSCMFRIMLTRYHSELDITIEILIEETKALCEMPWIFFEKFYNSKSRISSIRLFMKRIAMVLRMFANMCASSDRPYRFTALYKQ
jgi:hypothetical protein